MVVCGADLVCGAGVACGARHGASRLIIRALAGM